MSIRPDNYRRYSGVEDAMTDRLHDTVEECADCSGDIALTDVAGHYSGVCAKCRRAQEG